jgi:pectinesterase
VALRLTADRAVLTRVRLLGAQDTLYAASKNPDTPSRQYFRDCYIEGHVDFIFGDAKAFFDRCHIHGIANEIVMLTAQSKVKPE